MPETNSRNRMGCRWQDRLWIKILVTILGVRKLQQFWKEKILNFPVLKPRYFFSNLSPDLPAFVDTSWLRVFWFLYSPGPIRTCMLSWCCPGKSPSMLDSQPYPMSRPKWPYLHTTHLLNHLILVISLICLAQYYNFHWQQLKCYA